METPDRWMLVKVITEGETFYRMLASYFGGYCGGDAWRLSSRIKEFRKEDNGCFTFITESGNEYYVHPAQEGHSSYAYNNYKYYEDLADKSGGEFYLRLISFKESPYVGT